MDDERTLPPPVAAALEDARHAVEELRLAQYRCYRAVAHLDDLDSARAVGHRSFGRMVEEQLRLDAAHARRMLEQARAMNGAVSPSGADTAATLPATGAAMTEGVISEDHVTVVASTMTRIDRFPHVTPDAHEVIEAQLAGLARIRAPRALARDAAEILAKVEQDGDAPDDPELPEAELNLLRRKDGSLEGKFRYRDPVAAELLANALEAATPPAGSDGAPLEDLPQYHRSQSQRDLAERRAQGLLDLAADSLRRDTLADGLDADGPDADDHGAAESGADEAGADEAGADEAGADEAGAAEPEGAGETAQRFWKRPETEGGERVHVSVTIDWEALQTRATGLARLGRLDRPRRAVMPGSTIGPPGLWPEPEPPGSQPPGSQPPGSQPSKVARLGSGTLISPEVARRLACDAEIIPAVLGTGGQPLDIARRSRVVPAPMRNALVLRDQRCSHSGCRRRARRCAAHHVHHWADGGETCLDNLVLLCVYHHALIHHGGWQIHMIDGLPWFVPPPWVDPQRRPQHNRSWHEPTASPEVLATIAARTAAADAGDRAHRALRVRPETAGVLELARAS